MAGLTEAPGHAAARPWTAAQSRAQFVALARLRWRLFRNGFGRKGGTGELIARVLFLPLIGLVALGPILGAGFAGYYFVSANRLGLLPALTWGIFLLWQLVSINITAPALSFDINTIVRFPLSFPRYLIARLLFGLLSASNVIGTLAIVSADIGIGIASPSLLPWATLLLATYAAANVFFTRMIFAWVDRWLATRRARELFTAFIIFGSLGLQYLNVAFNPGLQNRHPQRLSSHFPFLIEVFHYLQPSASFLPPGLAASSIQSFSRGHIIPATASLLGLNAFAALFLAIYGWRMQREFRGENLSETIAPKASKKTAGLRTKSSPTLIMPARHGGSFFGLSPVLLACIEKEFLYLRRNTNQLYGFIAPIFMVFLFAGRIGAEGQFGDFVLPAAVAYSILGVSMLSYNSLGVDGSGIQLYFLAPARLRDVFLAKNIIGFLLNFVELILILAVICFVARPPSALIAVATLFWLLFTTFTNAAIGNLRSLSAPKKIDLGKVSRKQVSQLSALSALAVTVFCFVIGFSVVAVTGRLQSPWLMLPVLIVLAAMAFAFYINVLNRLDTVALHHRRALLDELCKVT